MNDTQRKLNNNMKIIWLSLMPFGIAFTLAGTFSSLPHLHPIGTFLLGICAGIGFTMTLISKTQENNVK